MLLWISGNKSDRPRLIELGCKVLLYKPPYYTCNVDEKAMKKLDPLWGEFFWGPIKKEESAKA
jgi:hypothetical protein